MDSLNIEETCEVLNKIMEYELAGVVRYTHYALMVTGPYRLPIEEFMQAQPLSLIHICRCRRNSLCRTRRSPNH